MTAKEKRHTIYMKFQGRCAYCGKTITIKEMNMDHIIPKSLFLSTISNKEADAIHQINHPLHQVPDFLMHLTINDLDHIDNLFPSCRCCNSWKTSFSVESFRHEISKQLDRLNKYNANYRFAKRYGLIAELPHKIKFYFEQIQDLDRKSRE